MVNESVMKVIFYNFLLSAYITSMSPNLKLEQWLHDMCWFENICVYSRSL